MGITDTHVTDAEIVLQERVVTTDYKIITIREFIDQRRVEVEVELGPFVTQTRGPEDNPETYTVSTGGRRGVTVWEGDEYDAVRDAWTNSDLIDAVKAKLA